MNEKAYLEGNQQYENGNYHEAIILFQSILQQDAEYEACYFAIGRCYEKLYYETKAIEYYQLGLKLCRDTEYISDYHLNIGNCFIMLSNPNQALFHFAESEKYDGNYMICQYNKALAYSCKNDYLQALTLFRFVLNAGMKKRQLMYHIEYCEKKLKI